MNLKPNETRTLEVQKLVSAMKLMNPGEGITDRNISGIIGREFQGSTDPIYSPAVRICEREHKIVIRRTPQGTEVPGCVRLTSDEVINLVANTPKRIRGMARRNLRRLGNLEPDQVTPEVHAQTTMNGLLLMFCKPKSVERIGDLSKSERKQIEPERVLEIFRK